MSAPGNHRTGAVLHVIDGVLAADTEARVSGLQGAGYADGQVPGYDGTSGELRPVAVVGGSEIGNAADLQIPQFNIAAAHWKARDADMVNAREMFEFGRQTSEADEPAAFQAAAEFAAGRPIFLDKGEYPGVDTLNDISQPLRIIGAGPDATRLIHKAPGIRLFQCKSSFDYLGETSSVNEYENGQQLTVAMPKRTTVITIPDTSGIAVGDYVRIRDEAQPLVSRWDGTTLGVAGQAFHVRSVDSATQITVYGGALYDYTTTARITRFVPIVNTIVKGVSIRPDDPLSLGIPPDPLPPGFLIAQSIAFDLQHCIDFTFDDVSFKEMAQAMIIMSHCVGGRVAHVRSENGRNDLSGGPYFNKFGPGAQDILLLDAESRYGRHVTTTTGSAHEIVPQLVTVAMCRAFEHSASPYDQHPAGRWFSYIGCMASMGNRDDQRTPADSSPVAGFQPRAWDTRLVNPVVVGHDVGVAATAGAERLSIDGGVLEGCKVGVFSYTLDGLRMRGTEIRDPGEHGILLTSLTKPGGTSGVSNIDIDRSVTITGDPSIAPVELQAWDDNNVVRPRLIGNTRRSVGLKTRQLAAADTLTIPFLTEADYFEVTGTTTITRITATAEQQGRRVTLLFLSGLTLDAENVPVTSTTIPEQTEIEIECDGTLWTERSRIVKPALLLLNKVSSASAWHAHAMRKLRFNYTGPLIRVRRSSDNTELDVGFDADGALDTAALLTFAGAGSAYMTTWYDQSTNATNVTQATTSRQPRIVNAGTVDTLDGKPAPVFDGVDDYMSAPSGLCVAAGTDGAAAFVVCGGTGASILGLISEAHAGPDTAVYGLLGVSSTSKLTSSVINDAIVSQLSSTGVDGTFFDGTLRVASVVDSPSFTDDGDGGDPVYSSNTQVFRNNGTADVSRTYTRTGTYDNINTLGIGARPVPSLYFPGQISEVLLFTRAVDATDRTLIEADQMAWVAA